jgi:hypothetical protein
VVCWRLAVLRKLIDDELFLPFRNFNSLGLLRQLSRAGVEHMQPREAHANSKVNPHLYI